MRRSASGYDHGRPTRFRFNVCAAMSAALAVGCQSYHWRTDYVQAEQDARDQNRHLFVFYKWWLDNDSNRMLSGEVLTDKEVLSQFQDTINVLVDRSGGPESAQYVARYGVNCFPAAILVAPDGHYEARTGFLPKDRFLEFVRQARQPRKPRNSATGKAGRPAHLSGPDRTVSQ